MKLYQFVREINIEQIIFDYVKALRKVYKSPKGQGDYS